MKDWESGWTRVEKFLVGALAFSATMVAFYGLVAFGFCSIVTFLGYKIVSAAYVFDERSLTALRFPVWIPYLSVTAGCTLVALRYTLRVCRLVFSFQPSQIMETH